MKAYPELDSIQNARPTSPYVPLDVPREGRRRSKKNCRAEDPNSVSCARTNDTAATLMSDVMKVENTSVAPLLDSSKNAGCTKLYDPRTRQKHKAKETSSEERELGSDPALVSVLQRD